MADFSLFHECSIAQLFTCSSRKHFGLVFGNVQVFQTSDELQQLVGIANRYMDQVRKHPCRACHPFIIKTQMENLQLRFTFSELKTLEAFLQEALFLLEVEALIFQPE